MLLSGGVKDLGYQSLVIAVCICVCVRAHICAQGRACMRTHTCGCVCVHMYVHEWKCLSLGQHCRYQSFVWLW